ncbi:MAG: universal stress protein [Alphaproteobacteria bacterium]|uniref:Universal stress protein n=1 Tax=Candidatus Nitrobium versatile TaxID=2884831 RepID=A0A953JDJ5_9BACT|nr:universal stress protein [Candidatus Nitrobium versatile]
MKILVPIDGSLHSMAGLTVAADYAKTKNARICLLSVVPRFEDVDLEISAGERERVRERLEQRASAVVEQARAVLEKEGVGTVTCKVVAAAPAVYDAIIDFAESERVDLIIIGSRGLSPSSRIKLGSIASKVVTHSPCSVYVVKTP